MMALWTRERDGDAINREDTVVPIIPSNLIPPSTCSEVCMAVFIATVDRLIDLVFECSEQYCRLESHD